MLPLGVVLVLPPAPCACPCPTPPPLLLLFCVGFTKSAMKAIGFSGSRSHSYSCSMAPLSFSMTLRAGTAVERGQARCFQIEGAYGSLSAARACRGMSRRRHAGIGVVEGKAQGPRVRGLSLQVATPRCHPVDYTKSTCLG